MNVNGAKCVSELLLTYNIINLKYIGAAKELTNRLKLSLEIQIYFSFWFPLI